MNSITTTTDVPATGLKATALGYPRIGPHRELKRALEAHWSGRLDAAGLEAAAASVRSGMLDDLAVLDTVPAGTFSLYNHVLDTIVAVDALAPRHRRETELASYFAAARGDDAAVPLEMTKWFDTNYHYLVPEIGARTPRSRYRAKAVAEYLEARERGLDARPVLLGPVTFLLLAKPAADAPARPAARPDRRPRGGYSDLAASPRRGRAGAARRAGAVRRPHPRGAGEDRRGLPVVRRRRRDRGRRRLRRPSVPPSKSCTRPASRASPSTWSAAAATLRLLRRWMFHVKHICSREWSTAATSGAPISPGRCRHRAALRASAIGFRFPLRLRCCTCPSIWIPRRTFLLAWSNGWPLLGRSCGRSPLLPILTVRE